MKAANRKVYFDYMRIIATLAVVILHTSAHFIHDVDVNEIDYMVFNLYDSAVRWAVPVFVMISGSLFLSKEVTLKQIYCKYILRLFISFVTWSLLYALLSKGTTKDKAIAFISGHYHMWFIIMIIGIYVCIPIIKSIVLSNTQIEYYLLLSFILGFTFPELITLMQDFGNETIINISYTLKDIVSKMNMFIVLGYSSYFILGYYLDNKYLNIARRKIIYLLGVLGFAFTAVVDMIVAIKTQRYSEHYYENFNVNILFEAIAVFLLIKNGKYLNQRINGYIQVLSKYCFGIFLVHPLIIEQFRGAWENILSCLKPFVAVPVISILVFVISCAISAILNQIPIIKKYMV